MEKGWTKIGEISVDAGLCWIGDPCYITEGKGPFGEDWTNFCNGIENMESFKEFNEGIVVQSGVGDGLYPVYAQFRQGVPSKILIDFWDGEK